MANVALTDTDDESVSSDRRIWKRRDGSQGTSQIVLTVFRILYDAGQPLTRDEIADRFLQQIDPYQRGYLEAWYLRLRGQQHNWNLKYRPTERRAKNNARLSHKDIPDVARVVRRWLSKMLGDRVNHTRSLIRDADGRYRLGPVAPSVQTNEGEKVSYTPAMRVELEETDHEASRGYLALLEWSKLCAKPEFQTAEARVQLLMLVARRLIIGENKSTMPLDERIVAPRLKYLLQLPDTPGTKRVLLQRILDDLFAVLDPKP